MDSLKVLAFYSAIGRETNSGLKACTGGDDVTVRDIILFSPSVLDAIIAISMLSQHKRESLRDLAFPGSFFSQESMSAPLIHLAASVGNLLHIRRLTTQGGDVNEQFRGSSPLHVAAENNCLDVVKELVSRGAILSAKDSEGFTAAHLACWRGKTDILLYFIEQNVKEPFSPPCLSDITYDGYFNYLHLAILGRHKETVAVLLQRGYDVNCPCKGGLPRSVVQRFLGDVPYEKWVANNTWLEHSPLALAALTGSLDVCCLLANKGANICYQNLQGETPLLCATKTGHLHLVEFLRSKMDNIQPT